jgi:hypothetical protein
MRPRAAWLIPAFALACGWMTIAADNIVEVEGGAGVPLANKGVVVVSFNYRLGVLGC